MVTTLDPVPLVPRAASLSCPSCGAAIVLKAQGWATTVACASCLAVLDATDPNLAILQQHGRAMRIDPRIPLGSRGTWSGAPWEVVGFQQVTITVDDEDYAWTEYVCFNPYRGFLYLSEYNGHWNVIEKLRRRPHVDLSGTRPVADFEGRTFKHFQSADAVTTFALGEFPWELRVGDHVQARDFIAPPYILSAEASDGELTWSRGTYTDSEQLRKAFGVPAAFPRPQGVFANQPNPYRQLSRGVGRSAALFALALLAMLVMNVASAGNRVSLSQSYIYDRADTTSAALVTPVFDLTGRTSRVALTLDTDVDNDWVFFTLSLINEQTGEVREVEQQVSAYRGTDSDGSWSEGDRRETVHLSSVPSGRYFLRIAPEGGDFGKPPIQYRVIVTRDVPSYLLYLLAAIALFLPALLALIPSASFEGRRWSESDYASTES